MDVCQHSWDDLSHSVVPYFDPIQNDLHPILWSLSKGLCMLSQPIEVPWTDIYYPAGNCLHSHPPSSEEQAQCRFLDCANKWGVTPVRFSCAMILFLLNVNKSVSLSSCLTCLLLLRSANPHRSVRRCTFPLYFMGHHLLLPCVYFLGDKLGAEMETVEGWRWQLCLLFPLFPLSASFSP